MQVDAQQVYAQPTLVALSPLCSATGDYETRSLGLLKPGGTFVNFLAKSTIWPLVKG